MKRKHIAIVIVLVIILAGITFIKPKTIEYIKGDTEIVEKTIEIETLQKRIVNAKVAEEMNIEAKAYKTYLDTRDRLEKEIELKVTSEYRAEIEAREAKLEEEVSL